MYPAVYKLFWSLLMIMEERTKYVKSCQTALSTLDGSSRAWWKKSEQLFDAARRKINIPAMKEEQQHGTPSRRTKLIYSHVHFRQSSQFQNSWIILSHQPFANMD